MLLHLQSLISLLAVLHLSYAQDAPQEKVWGVFMYTLHGDRTPLSSLGSGTLTPLGAYQLFGAGYAVRSLYVSPSTVNATDSTRQISGISEYSLVNDEIEILSTTEQFVSASAQAFMQGLYPPLEELSDDRIYLDDYRIVNGTLMDYPLRGYQYSSIVTAGPEDPVSIQVAGHSYCPSHAELQSQYLGSTDARQVVAETAPFYADLYDRVLHGVFTNETVNYYNAHHISDYLDYQYIHNSTARRLISPEDLDRVHYLADRLVFAANSNETVLESKAENENIKGIAGKTLAYYIVQALDRNIRTRGARNKLSLGFGSVEPMVAFHSLLGLPSPRQPNFYSRPNHGASLIIELFSWELNPLASYPTSKRDLMVRFLLRNGTDPWDLSTDIIPYPMFGLGPNHTAMPYREFLDRLIDMMMGPYAWCRACSSTSIFCSAYTSGADSHNRTLNARRGMRPIVAGVIGFIVGFIALLLILVLISCCGFRSIVNCVCSGFRRKRKDPGSAYSNSQVGWPASPSAQSSTVCNDQAESMELSTRVKSHSSYDSPVAYLANPTRENDADSLIHFRIQPVKPHEVV
ncbi:hypothetical protein VTO42DRAFT_2065 [Malbranchea cinnamomea]